MIDEDLLGPVAVVHARIGGMVTWDSSMKTFHWSGSSRYMSK